MRVEVVRPEPDGGWRHSYFGSGDRVPLHAIDVGLEVDEVYREWVATAAERG